MPTYNIDIKKSYNIPSNIAVIRHNNKILVIDSERANWIVLDSDLQLNVFKTFQRGTSIECVLESYKYDDADVRYVVTQIEAKQFYETVSDPRPKDSTLHFYLTNRCNLSCPHCYMFSGMPINSELETNEIKTVLNDFAKIGEGRIVTFSGGEPTIRKDFEEILEYAYRLGLEIKLMTNGTTLPSERIAILSRYLSSVQISIDGFSEETNAEIRGHGSFQKSLDTVDTFIANDVYTSIAITPKINTLIENSGKYATFAQELESRYEGKAFELRISEELLNGRCITDAKSINVDYGKAVANLMREIYGEDYKIMEFVKMLTDNSIIDNCAFGGLTIAANGDVFLCPRINDLKPVGNVRTDPFKELLKKATFVEEFTNVRYLHPCGECELRYICGGGCRIEEFPHLVSDELPNIKSEYDSNCRICNSTFKNKFYDLMIDSNEYFYKELE